ncbi:hypothetical protein [Ferruginibacter sp. HRS2-29]|uniref:hypothetical protein n=1 Tax=Ferruginibacter sp. HRS2-29 TaxID=2487334 RepID=UPI0020CFB71B|nr:hypothetical protein [Ferruginibacter sp. HRS2-29]MCP9752897.1 hypothetical protein [Ferruginibacter sp. HRS2-29]
MNVDEIISGAFMNSMQGEGLFIVEGNPKTNQLRILPADQALRDNLNCFTWDINTGFQYLGIFTEQSLAQNHIDKIREKIRNDAGDRLI